MGTKRTLILVAAVVIGAVAAFSLFTYVNGIEEQAYEDREPVTVYVVTRDIPGNTPGSVVLNDKAIEARLIPQEFRPQSALTDPGLIKDKVAKGDLVPGQVVITGMFVDPAESEQTWAERIPVDRVAVTVSLDQVRSVAGLLSPGDTVTMMVTLDGAQAGIVAGEAPTEESGGATAGTGAVQFLYQNVEIMQIGQGGPVGGGEGAAPVGSTGLITFMVPPEAAARIALAGSQIYLALEPRDFQPVDVPPVDYTNLFQTPGLTPDERSAA